MSKIQAFVSLDIKLQAYSQNEIIERIPKEVYSEILKKDEHPFFQMYSIAHEGTSSPKILGKGHKPITWLKQSIQSISKVIENGIKYFSGHNKTNDIQDKKILGETIHAFEEMIDGKLHYCTIGYFPPETREEAKEMDICSQESEWNLVEVAGRLFADTCKGITGIALGNSQYQQPAFEHAKRLGFIQAFEDKETKGDDDNVSGKEKESKKMTFQEIQQAVKEMNVYPSQLYSLDEIKKDREFTTVFSELDTVKNNLQSKEKEIEELTKTKNDLDRTIKLGTAKDKLKSLYKDLNYTDNIQKFVDKMYDENRDKLDDLTDEGLKNFAESQKKVFQLATGAEEKKPDLNLPTGDGKGNVDLNDPTKPENNPLLSEAYNPDDYI